VKREGEVGGDVEDASGYKVNTSAQRKRSLSREKMWLACGPRRQAAATFHIVLHPLFQYFLNYLASVLLCLDESTVLSRTWQRTTIRTSRSLAWR
jgi:hypothetical protein